MIARITCLVAAAVLVAAQPQGNTKKVPSELQGAWQLVAVKAGTETVDLSKFRATLVVEVNQLLYGGEKIGRLSADVSAKPKLIDLHFSNPGRVYEGVYTVKKDSLKICLNRQTEGVKERPNSFSVKGHSNWRVLIFRHVKGDKAKGSGFVGLLLRFDKKLKQVVVDETFDKSPAKKAGLRKGDILLQVASTAVTGLRSAVEAVREAKPHSDLAVRFRRGNKEAEVKIKVGLLPFTLLAGLG